jgi:FkbM family methyltransferase
MRVPIWSVLKYLIHKLLFSIPARNRFQFLSFHNILNKNFPSGSEFSFIQVGANDGISHDALYDFVKQHRSKGIVIEPLEDLYKKLSENYSYNKNIIPVQKAVHPHLKEITMYKVDPAKQKELPPWSSGIGSVFPDHYKRSGIASSDIIAERVKADHFMNITSQHGFSGAFDLLQIDVEGFDYEVLKQLDFKILQPSIIKFEIINLEKKDWKAAIQILKQQGYSCFQNGLDIIAVQLRTVRI